MTEEDLNQLFNYLATKVTDLTNDQIVNFRKLLDKVSDEITEELKKLKY